MASGARLALGVNHVIQHVDGIFTPCNTFHGFNDCAAVGIVKRHLVFLVLASGAVLTRIRRLGSDPARSTMPDRTVKDTESAAANRAIEAPQMPAEGRRSQPSAGRKSIQLETRELLWLLDPPTQQTVARQQQARQCRQLPYQAHLSLVGVIRPRLQTVLIWPNLPAIDAW